MPYQKVALNKSESFNAYEAARNGEYTCFISQLAPEGSPVKYYYGQIKLLFAPRLLAEISDIKNIQGIRYSLNDETLSTTTRYARCLFPTSEKLSMLLLKHLQFDPSKALPDDLWIDEAPSSAPLSKTSVLLKIICGRTIKSSEGYPTVTIEINYDDCIELHLEFLLPPDLPTHPVWNDDFIGGGGGVGGDLVDSDDNVPPMCPNNKDKLIKKYYCDKTRVFDLTPSQYKDIKEIIDRIRRRGVTCAKLADIGDMLLVQKGFVVSKIDPKDRGGHEPFAFTATVPTPAYFSSDGRLQGVSGAWITIDPKNWDISQVKYLGSKRITLEWIIVHELDHILLGSNVEHISYTYEFDAPPNTTLYTKNTAECSYDAKTPHPKTIL